MSPPSSVCNVKSNCIAMERKVHKEKKRKKSVPDPNGDSDYASWWERETVIVFISFDMYQRLRFQWREMMKWNTAVISSNVYLVFFFLVSLFSIKMGNYWMRFLHFSKRNFSVLQLLINLSDYFNRIWVFNSFPILKIFLEWVNRLLIFFI